MTWAGRLLTVEPPAVPSTGDPCACLELQAEASNVLTSANSDDFDEALLDALQRTCLRLGLGHAAVLRTVPDARQDQRLTHVVLSQGTRVPPDPFLSAERFPWCQTRVAEGEVLVLGDVEDLPPTAVIDRASWHALGLTGELVYPMLGHHGHLVGTLVFGGDPGRPAFRAETVELLRGVAHVVATAILRHDSERERQESEARFRQLSDHALVGIYFAQDGMLSYVNSALADMLGYTVEELTGADPFSVIAPEDVERMRHNMQARLAGLEAEQHYEFTGLRKDGSRSSLELYAASTTLDHRPAIVGNILDVTAEREARRRLADRELQLEHVIDHDIVTGLANLPAALAYIGEQLGRGSTSSRSLAVLGIRVDSLAAINAAYTHAVGDVLLATLAHRIEEVVGKSGLVGRGTGAEFLVILPDLPERSSAAVTAELVRQAARAPLLAGGHEVSSTVSIGIATGGPGGDPALLVRDAGLATRRAKDAGRDRVALFDPSLAVDAERSVAVLADVRAGLLRDELVAWYQPIVRFGEDRVVGFEALVRWRRSDGRHVPPDEFLPVIERSAQIADLDLAVLAQAARALAHLSTDQFVSVNVSARTLTLVDYAEEIVRAVREARVDPARLHVEVTETTRLSVSEDVEDAMRAVAGTGARWYVDDFGTGYSSIAHLRDLPVSGLKLDLSFTAGILRGDTRSSSLAQALVDMAHGLGLDTVAEGVETQRQAEILATQGWLHGQGWHYGRPMPLHEWLAPRDPRAADRTS